LYRADGCRFGRSGKDGKIVTKKADGCWGKKGDEKWIREE